MTEQWFTYSELAERLKVSTEAARQKAIRNRWPRRTGNDGRAQVRLDIEEVVASTIPRKPRDEEVSDDCPTPEQPPGEPLADTRALEALNEHIVTLKGMVAKAEEVAERERLRAEREGVRAETERLRSDAERARADELAKRLDEVRGEGETKRAEMERDLVELRSVVERMQRPWWKRLAG